MKTWIKFGGGGGILCPETGAHFYTYPIHTTGSEDPGWRVVYEAPPGCADVGDLMPTGENFETEELADNRLAKIARALGIDKDDE